MFRTFHNQTNIVMCSFLPDFNSFNRTKGGLIQLSHGRPQPLQGASIPKNRIKYSCKGGYKWRDAKRPNPKTVVGAMVAGPDRHDGFHDVREPTLDMSLSGEKPGIDKNTIFSVIPPMFPPPPPPPPLPSSPWKP